MEEYVEDEPSGHQCKSNEMAMGETLTIELMGLEHNKAEGEKKTEKVVV